MTINMSPLRGYLTNLPLFILSAIPAGRAVAFCKQYREAVKHQNPGFGAGQPRGNEEPKMWKTLKGLNSPRFVNPFQGLGKSVISLPGGPRQAANPGR